VDDIHGLPETQRTALVLREMDALSYEQIAEAMDTTVPGVKSLLVRARISLAEAAEARQLSCDEVRIELGEVAEGLQKRPTPLVRRHLRSCRRCASFQGQLKQTNKALAALLPIGPLALLRQLLIAHIGHSAGTGSGATAAGATAGATGGAGAGGMAAAAGTAGGTAAFSSVGGLISAGAGAVATKAAAGLAAAALVTAGAVEATHVTTHRHLTPAPSGAVPVSGGSAVAPAPQVLSVVHSRDSAAPAHTRAHHHAPAKGSKAAAKTGLTKATPVTSTATTDKQKLALDKSKQTQPGRTTTQTDATVLSTQPEQPAPDSGATDTTSSASSQPDSSTASSTGTTGPTGPTGPSSGGGSLPSDSSGGDTTSTTSSTPPDTTTTDTTLTPAPTTGP